jgi:prepilin peptidase CpaA
MDMADVIVVACVVVFATVAAVCDFRTRKLPNKLTVPAFCVGLVFHAVKGCWLGGLSGMGVDLLFALQGFAVGFGIMMVLWLIGGSGGGDVKFMGALGCWLGAWITFQVMIVSAVFAGALTVTLTVKNAFRLKRTPLARHEAGPERGGRKRAGSAWRVPYGVPVALAAWCVLGLQLAGYSLHWPPIH